MIPPIPNVKKIAVLRANALGDFIFALPALFALKETYPKAELIYLGKQWHKEFLKNRPSPIDRVIPIPPFPGVGENENSLLQPQGLSFEMFFKKMKQEQFDVAIQLHGGGKNSNPFLLKLGAKLNVGLKTQNAPPLDKWIPYVYYHNEVLRYLEVVSLIDAKTKHISPTITVTNNDKKEALSFLPKTEKPIIVLHPGASDIRRRWLPEYFALVGDNLALKGAIIVISGIKEEQEIINTVLENMEYKAINLCGKLTLCGFTGLLSYASLVITNDTGPLHLAHALGTPTVGLYWCGNMINGGQITRAIHRPVISWVINCPLCKENCAEVFPFESQKKQCTHETSFINVTPQEVILAAEDLLKRGKF